MTTPRSTATSPTSQSFPQDLFPLDFLTFGLDQTSPNLNISSNPTPELAPATLANSQQNHPSSSSSSSSHTFNNATQFERSQSHLVGHMMNGENGGLANGQQQLLGIGSSHSDSGRENGYGGGGGGGGGGSVHSDGPSRGGSSRGKSRGGKRSNASMSGGGSGGGRGNPINHGQQGVGMDIDQAAASAQQQFLQLQQLHGTLAQFQNIQQQMGAQGTGFMNDMGSGGVDGFDAIMEGLGGQMGGVSAGMLQQLEGIHMQSPLVFDPNNPSQAYNPMAQFLASPAGQSQMQGQMQGQGQSQSEGDKKYRPVMMNGGLITPGASSEMYPQLRPEQVSPMRLEMFARGENMDGVPDASIVPLLSPALTQGTASQFTSPANAAAFYAQSPLEALQEQQRQFQEQLNALQIQQKQLQATAAAVAAAAAAGQPPQHQQHPSSSNSPFIGSNSSQQQQQQHHSGASSGQSRPVTTPGVLGSAEPSPSYFSPLTSPALEANRHYHTFSNGGLRQPHPLSALSSPALNPIGSSGGAQQTLSPALQPQSNADMNDPEYIRALVGMLDNAVSADGNQNMHSGVHGTTTPYNQQQQGFRQAYSGSGSTSHSRFQSPSNIGVSSLQSSPINGSNAFAPVFNYPSASGSNSGPNSVSGNTPNMSSSGNPLGPGPHRQSLPLKSRPSPLIKPVNHRSHIRQPSHGPHIGSLPGSPLIPKGIQPGTYLPPTAVDQKMHAAASIASTPSPVDLAQIMPPPPVPRGQKVTPMTPAALMNLGGGGGGANMDVNVQMTGMMPGQALPTINTDLGNLLGGDLDYGAGNMFNGNLGVNIAGPSKATGAAGGGRKGSRMINGTEGTSMGKNGNAANAKLGDVAGGSARLQAKRTNAMTGGTSGQHQLANSSGAITAGKRGQKVGPSGKKLAARPAGVGVRAATKAAAAQALLPEGEVRKTSHKAAEQKRRDSLKAGFDELRLLLPPINTEALDPESGEPIPGSSAPRLLPKSSLVPDDNPNRGVSKVALLKFSNEYIVKLHERVDKRDGYIEKLRMEVERLRNGEDEEEVKGEEGEDLLDVDIQAGEDDDFGPKPDPGEDEDEEEGDVEVEGGDEGEDGEEPNRSGTGSGDGDGELINEDGMDEVEDEGMMQDDEFEDLPRSRRKVPTRGGSNAGGGVRKNGPVRPKAVKHKSTSSSGTIKAR